MKEDVIAGNKIIAEFMGAKCRISSWEGREDVVLVYPFDSEGYALPPIVADYESSWDWLMPVVEKIEELRFICEIKDTACWISKYVDHIVAGGRIKGTKIEAVWLAVVEFIKWYNQTTSK